MSAAAEVLHIWKAVFRIYVFMTMLFEQGDKKG
jgi:hypothetical protein